MFEHFPFEILNKEGEDVVWYVFWMEISKDNTVYYAGVYSKDDEVLQTICEGLKPFYPDLERVEEADVKYLKVKLGKTKHPSNSALMKHTGQFVLRLKMVLSEFYDVEEG